MKQIALWRNFCDLVVDSFSSFPPSTRTPLKQRLHILPHGEVAGHKVLAFLGVARLLGRGNYLRDVGSSPNIFLQPQFGRPSAPEPTIVTQELVFVLAKKKDT